MRLPPPRLEVVARPGLTLQAFDEADLPALAATLLQSHRYGDGRYHDEHLHARLADEHT